MPSRVNGDLILGVVVLSSVFSSEEGLIITLSVTAFMSHTHTPTKESRLLEDECRVTKGESGISISMSG